MVVSLQPPLILSTSFHTSFLLVVRAAFDCRLEGVDVCIPSSVEFAGLDVVTDGHDVAHLEDVLVDAVAEEVELDLLWVGVESLEDVLLFLPGVA